MLDKKFHYWLPSWMKIVIRKRKCSKCNYPINDQDIIAVGIRELQGRKQSCLFTEHQCSQCLHRSITTFGKEKIGTIQGMCFTLLDSIERKKKLEKAHRITEKFKDEMSDKNVNDFLKFLYNVESHDEFLKKIGSPTEKNESQSS